jgi:HEPN domain-containing protein
MNMYTMFLMIELAERYPLTHSLSEIAEKVGGRCGKIVVNVSLWVM